MAESQSDERAILGRRRAVASARMAAARFSAKLLDPLWKAGQWAVDAVYPPACVVCRSVLDSPPDQRGGIPGCTHCLQAVARDCAQPYCPGCGRPAAIVQGHNVVCPTCWASPPRWTRMVRVGTYGGTVGTLIRRYKLERQQHLDLVLGALLADALLGTSWHQELDALVPVPAGWRERWRYGFAPVTTLARITARRLRRPLIPAVRVRGKTRRQMELTPSERLTYMRGKLFIHPAARIQGATLCVVDDVATTNATVDEMTRVLLAAGAAKVYVAVLAKATRHAVPTEPPSLDPD